MQKAPIDIKYLLIKISHEDLRVGFCPKREKTRLNTVKYFYYGAMTCLKEVMKSSWNTFKAGQGINRDIVLIHKNCLTEIQQGGLDL